MLCLSGFELYSRWVPLIDVVVLLQNLLFCESQSIYYSGC